MFNNLMYKLSNLYLTLQELLSRLSEKFFPNIYDPKELRRVALIYSVSNVLSGVFFYTWHLSWIQGATGSMLFWVSLIMHLSIGARFLKNSQKFGRLAFSKWAWLNLIGIAPFLGFILGYYVFNSKYWLLDEVNKDETLLQQEIEKSKQKIPMKQKKLEARFNQSLAQLKKINQDVAREILSKALHITHHSFEELSFYQITAVIALATMCKQSKQKTFDNLIWGAHWYEDNFFTFGFKNSKPVSMYNKYPLIVGAIVLDELDNYRKILEAKELIKKNLSFSDAKIISLHMGSEYKLFTNQ